MRVVGGEWRGRAIDAPPEGGGARRGAGGSGIHPGSASRGGSASRAGSAGPIRPTTDRARETLFNVLAHDPLVRLEGGAVLDAFAGTGALGIEALSRGAASATFVERDAAARRLIAGTLRRLGGETRARILALDATRPGAAPLPHDLALLDPPYGRGLGERAATALVAGGWLAAAATVVIEEERGAVLAWPPEFEPLREIGVGATRFHLARLGG